MPDALLDIQPKMSENKGSAGYMHTHTTVLQPFFRDHPGEWVPEKYLWTLWCKGRGRGRHTDHPTGHHSVQTNPCPPPPSLIKMNKFSILTTHEFVCSVGSKRVFIYFIVCVGWGVGAQRCWLMTVWNMLIFSELVT